MCREMLEFRDNIPARRHKPHLKRITKNGKKIPRISYRGTGQRFNRMVSAFTRYRCWWLVVMMMALVMLNNVAVTAVVESVGRGVLLSTQSLGASMDP